MISPLLKQAQGTKNAKLIELATQIGDKTEEVKKQFDVLDTEGGREPTADEFKSITERNKEIEGLEEQFAKLLEVEGIRLANSQRKEALNAPVKGTIFAGLGDEQKSDVPSRLSDQVLSDEGFKGWLENITAGGRVKSQQFGSSPHAQVKTLITGESSTSAGALVVTDRKPILDPGTFQRPDLTMRDIITVGTTDGDLVEYVRVTGFTNNAAPTAEATDVDDGDKPESAMTLAVVQEAVKTIAHWIPATRRALSDAGQLRTLIDSFLRYGADEELEDQMLTGSGSGENFTGVLNTANISTQAWSNDLLETTRKARTKVRTLGRARPTAYVLNPADWEALDLLQDNEARYYFGGPSQMGTPRLWGLPVVESEGMTSGTGMVADWRLAVLWDRMQTEILVSDSHSDFFTRNLIAILAEMRAAFGVLRPKAFVSIDLTA